MFQTDGNDQNLLAHVFDQDALINLKKAFHAECTSGRNDTYHLLKGQGLETALNRAFAEVIDNQEDLNQMLRALGVSLIDDPPQVSFAQFCSWVAISTN